MPLADLLSLDIDTTRFVIVASVVVGAIVYSRLRISAGGALTGGYVVLLALSGQWTLIAVIAVVALLSLVVIRGIVTRFVALPKEWLFIGMILMSALIMSAILLSFRYTGPVYLPGGLQIVLVVGSFITPGLVAYDVAFQGPRATSIGLALVIAGTMLIVVPVLIFANVLRPESSTVYIPGYGEIPPTLYWLATIAAVLIAGALRLTFGIRSAGFIGAIFIVTVLSWAAFVTIGIAALLAYAVVALLERYILFSPRQRFQTSLLAGMLLAWLGLYWGARLGWPPAMAANSYALEPLIAVGLMAADMGRQRSSVPKTYLGTGIGVVFVLLVVYAATSGQPVSWIATPLLLVIPLALALPAVQDLRISWRTAFDSGRAAARDRLTPPEA